MGSEMCIRDRASIPMINQIPVTKVFVVAMNDIWLYNYHDITYGPKISRIFDEIRNI